jgi:hypothetical protein
MKRSKMNTLVDIVSFGAFIFLTSTGILVRYILPPGSGRFTTLWGLDRHAWGDIHFWVALAFFACLSAHLFLHWKWILSLLKGKKRQGSGLRAALGIVGVVTVLALALAPLLVPVEQTTSRKEVGDFPNSEMRVRGSMTLAEVEDATHVPRNYLIRELGLPVNIPPSESLRSLGGRYGFGVQRVREVVEQYERE